MKIHPQAKKVLIAVGIGVAAFAGYSMYAAFKSGVTAISDILSAPFTALQNEWNAISGAASSVASSAANISAGNQAAATIATQNNSDYAPGGTIYNQILATQGQAAADAAWATVQSHEATQTDQTSNSLLGAIGL